MAFCGVYYHGGFSETLMLMRWLPGKNPSETSLF
tara:strand:- start:101 stop:202 length:102 start_codon:yes stop_codon:yes gene_type:complete